MPDHDHSDGQDHGHTHDDRPPDPALLEVLEGLERHTLHSVGIDIGSSTSHLAMSRLVIQRRGSDLSSEYIVSERETLYHSPIWLTPYQPDGAAIDVAKLQSYFEESYRASGIGPEEIDTGAVVITGEALKKENAEQIAQMTARWSGRFICVSAGPNHEALLAAHGSGSIALSESGNLTVVNVDLGGGTTKISVIHDGVVTHLEAFSVGARLLAFDDDGKITRMEEPARTLLDHLDIPVGLGDKVEEADRGRIAELMATVVVDNVLAGSGSKAELYAALHVASDQREMPPAADIDHVVFSGGVSEFLAADPPAGFGDLGHELGQALDRRMEAMHLADKIRPAVQGIRATVMGASQFTVQASGQTCYLSNLDVLPVRGLQAVHLDFRSDQSDEAVRAALRQRDLDEWNGALIAALTLSRSAAYPEVRHAAEALARAASVDPTMPLFVVLRQDLAHSLGAVLKEELKWAGPVMVVDGITVGELDHVDLGTPLGRSKSLPVTVTSLEFPQPVVAPHHDHHTHEHVPHSHPEVSDRSQR